MVKIDSQAKRVVEAGVHELSQRSTSVAPTEDGDTVAFAEGAVIPQFIRDVPSYALGWWSPSVIYRRLSI